MNFNLPTYYIDKSIKEELKKDLEKYAKILVISGEKSLLAVKDIFEYALVGKNVIYENYNKECCYKNINSILERVKDERCDIVIGVGGGKSLDVSKVVADRLGVLILTVPTIASTCAGTSALSVIYDDESKFLEFITFKMPPKKIYIDLSVIKNAPLEFIWAGLGDTLAKFYEVDLKYRYFTINGEKLSYKNTLGHQISTLCKKLVIENGVDAIVEKEITEDYKNAVLSIIVNTGLVSNLIDDELNGAIAHSVCYSLGNIKEIEENHLHGEMVAYGILVQLLLEGNQKEYDMLYKFYLDMKFPVELISFINLDEFKKYEDRIVDLIINAPDMPILMKRGFKVTKEDIKRALYYIK